MTKLETKIQACREQLREWGEEPLLASEIETIQAACCAAFGVSFGELVNKRRTQRATYARMASMAMSRSLMSHSLKIVADLHGRRDHATVAYAVSKFDGYCERIPEFKAGVDRARKLLTAKPWQKK